MNEHIVRQTSQRGIWERSHRIVTLRDIPYGQAGTEGRPHWRGAIRGSREPDEDERLTLIVSLPHTVRTESVPTW